MEASAKSSMKTQSVTEMEDHSWRARAEKLAYYDVGFSAIVIIMAIVYALIFTGAALAVLKPDIVFGGHIQCTAGQPIVSKTKHVKDGLWNTWIITVIFIFSSLSHAWAAGKLLSAAEIERDATVIFETTNDYFSFSCLAYMVWGMLLCGFATYSIASYIGVLIVGSWVLGRGLFIHISAKIVPEEPNKLSSIPKPV